MPLPSLTQRTTIAAHYLSKLDVDASALVPMQGFSFGAGTFTCPAAAPASDDSALIEECSRNLAAITAGWSGADIAAVCQEAGMLALRRDLRAGRVGWSDVTRAKASVHAQRVVSEPSSMPSASPRRSPAAVKLSRHGNRRSLGRPERRSPGQGYKGRFK